MEKYVRYITKLGYEPDLIDIEALIDTTLTFKENKQILKEHLHLNNSTDLDKWEFQRLDYIKEHTPVKKEKNYLSNVNLFEKASNHIKGGGAFNKTPLSKIKIPYQTRKFRNNRLIPFEGIDVETDKTGYARVIANSRRYVEVNNIIDVLKFLCSKDFQTKLNFHYNLAFDFEVMFKHEPEIFKKLLETQEIKYGMFTIKYIPRKLYSLSWKHKSRKFYDIAQFFKRPLADASEKYLGLKAHELKGDRANLFENHTIPEIGEYCIHDCYLTKKLAEYFYIQLRKLSLFPLNPISPGSIAEDYLKKNTHVPYFVDVPRHIQDMYWKAYRGGWFDTYQKGYFDDAYQYDISSAYPWALTHIPDPERGRWIEGTDSDTGVMRALIKRKDGYPVFSFPGAGVLVYYDIPSYTEVYMTLREYHTLKKDYDIEVLESYAFEQSRRTRFPFQGPVHDLYRLKQSKKNDIGLYMTVKEIVNSFYGKTAQRIKILDVIKAGNMFNPMFACECTAFTRMQVYEASRTADIISFCADGFISSSPAKIPLGDRLGDWEIKHEKEPLVQVGNGIYQFSDNKCKHRGWKEKRDLNHVLDTDKNPINISVTRPWHWRECVRQHRIEDIGIFDTQDKLLDVIGDKKRFWLDSPRSPRELLTSRFDSVPIPII